MEAYNFLRKKYYIPSEKSLDEFSTPTFAGWDSLVKLLEEYSSQLEPKVMPMLTGIEVRSGWEDWLNNSFKYYKKYFSDKLRKSNKRSGVIETPKKWIENYYKELLEVTERYLNASKHSA